MSDGWIGVDLDGTLAEYHDWPADGSIGKPIPKMVERVKSWLREGKDVRIFTARVWPIGTNMEVAVGKERYLQASEQYWHVKDWCIKELAVFLPVTCTKDYQMIELWDDRAVQVIPNTGERADASDLPTPSPGPIQA